jgi:type I restriction enzyme, S subunit
VNGLPPGWARASLADVAENLDWRRIPINSTERAHRTGTVPYYGATGRVGWIDDYLFDEELVLLGEDGAPFLERDKSKAYMISGPSWVNNHAHVLRGRAVANKYLLHYLNYFDYHGYANGTTRLKLTQSQMNRIPLPIAPSAEQERIVAAIEEQFSRLDAGEAALGRARQKIKRMRAAVLEAAVKGRLLDIDDKSGLVDHGLEPRLPRGWSIVPAGDIAEVSGGITKNPKRLPHDNAIPFLRVANVMRDQLDLEEIHYIEVFKGELERFCLRRGDLLVVEGNGSPDQIGRSALWDGSIDPCVHQNHLIRVRPGSKILPEYLNIFWNAPSSMAMIQAAASSTSGLHTLSTGKVRSIQVVLPPLPVQHNIVEEVDRQLSALSALDHQVAIAETRGRVLRSAILATAFSGNLVQQDPTEEPASVFLERIEAERPASNSNRSRRGRKPRMPQEEVSV